jgi:hypothetical protein
MRRYIAYDSYDWSAPMRQNQGTVTSQSIARTYVLTGGAQELNWALASHPG